MALFGESYKEGTTLRGCIQSLLLMTFADLKSIGVFNTDF